jgi:short-subunit dehydrogenase
MNIVITGSSRGIGYETAKTLATDPSNSILAISRSESGLLKLSKGSQYENIQILTTDIVELSKHPEKLTKEVLKAFKTIDVLINNAGIVIPKLFKDLTDIDDTAVIETNFIAPLKIIRTLLPMMQRGSHIVNIGSMGGLSGSPKYPGLTVYSASKAALAVLTESLALEYKESGISFNCLSFGAVQTEMLDTAFPGFKAPVSADEMADFVSWFALNGQKIFNGKVLPVSVSNP